MRQNKKEERLQSAIARYLRLQYPDVIFTSESSGIRVPMSLAVQMKAQRSNHKQLDLIILEPRGWYYGLIIELKKDRKEIYLKKGGYSKKPHIQEQLKSIELLKSKGYYSCFSCGFDETKDLIDKYMSLSYLESL